MSVSLPDALAGWDVAVRLDPYPLDEHTKLARVIEALDPASEAQDIVLYPTDLPRRDGNRPVIADISLRHRFGLISVVGVGGIFIGRRVSVLVHSAIADVDVSQSGDHGLSIGYCGYRMEMKSATSPGRGSLGRGC
jgi:hypothetical protein